MLIWGDNAKMKGNYGIKNYKLHLLRWKWQNKNQNEIDMAGLS